MVIAVANISGNVGKSFIAREVLYPYCPETKKLIEVETLNSGSENKIPPDINYTRTGPEDFENIFVETQLFDNVVIDIGASCVMDFFDKISENSLNEDFFDKIIVPTTLYPKELEDSLNFMDYLIRDKGVPKSKLVGIFNKVEPGQSLEELRPSLEKDDDSSFDVLDPDIQIPLFDLSLLSENIELDKDYLKEIKRTKEEAEKNGTGITDTERFLIESFAKSELKKRKMLKIKKTLEEVADKLSIYFVGS